jgi:DNA-binding Xre family transcriptional regulator
MKNALQHVWLKSTLTSTNELSSAIGPWRNSSIAGADVFNAIGSVAPPAEWADPEYRRAAMEANVSNMVAWQVHVNRDERGLTQSQLAELMGTGQSAISKLEDPDGGDILLSTLVKAANAFDCALLVRFVDYTALAAATRDVRPERLYVAPFGMEPASALLHV